VDTKNFASVMVEGKLNTAEGSQEHLDAAIRATSLEDVEDLGGWGVSLRLYELGETSWKAVVVTKGDLTAPAGARLVNVHAFTDTEAAVHAFKAVSTAVQVVTSDAA
jgi:hypothetical protein